MFLVVIFNEDKLDKEMTLSFRVDCNSATLACNYCAAIIRIHYLWLRVNRVMEMDM